MARVTKAQLEEQLAAMQARLGELEQKHRELDIAYDYLHEEHKEVVAQLEAKPKVVLVRKQAAQPKPIVTRFYRGGQLWEKTRVGNVATERVINPA